VVDLSGKSLQCLIGVNITKEEQMNERDFLDMVKGELKELGLSEEEARKTKEMADKQSNRTLDYVSLFNVMIEELETNECEAVIWQAIICQLLDDLGLEGLDKAHVLAISQRLRHSIYDVFVKVFNQSSTLAQKTACLTSALDTGQVIWENNELTAKEVEWASNRIKERKHLLTEDF
jgi:hypothetical protein